MTRQRIGVVMGGTSAERDVSLATGGAVARALEGAGHEVARLDLSSGRDALKALASTRMDVAFLALHGRLGEDGCVQGVLEVLGIPYTGSDVLASALAMDKLKAKELFRHHNVPTPPYYEIRAEEAGHAVELHGSFGFPVVVKPRREGSSIGVALAHDAKELETAVAVGLSHDRSVLVERFVKGREIAVGLLDDRVLGAIEIAKKRDLYDYEAKYTPGASEYFIPARVPATRMRGVLNIAEHAARALGTRGACRVDLLVTEGMNEYVLEVNTLPGMTPTSLLPKIAEAAGFGFTELCETIVARALARRATESSPPVATPAKTRPLAVAV